MLVKYLAQSGVGLDNGTICWVFETQVELCSRAVCAFNQQRSVVPASPDIRLGEIGRVPNTVRMYQSGEPNTAELDMCQESHDSPPLDT